MGKSFRRLTIVAPRVVDRRAPRFLERMIDVFTRNYFSLVLLFMENRERQGMTFVENRNLSLGILANGDLSLAHCVAWAGSDNLVNNFLVLNGQVLR